MTDDPWQQEQFGSFKLNQAETLFRVAISELEEQKEANPEAVTGEIATDPMNAVTRQLVAEGLTEQEAHYGWVRAIHDGPVPWLKGK